MSGWRPSKQRQSVEHHAMIVDAEDTDSFLSTRRLAAIEFVLNMAALVRPPKGGHYTGTTVSISVPLPGVEAMVIRPRTCPARSRMLTRP